jgi:hypothetical protein
MSPTVVLLLVLPTKTSLSRGKTLRTNKRVFEGFRGHLHKADDLFYTVWSAKTVAMLQRAGLRPLPLALLAAAIAVS